MAFLLTTLGAALACGLELLEALAIVLAVAVTRRTRDALLGAGAAVLVCAAVGATLGPVLVANVSLTPLRLVVGVALLLFGLEWLRKGILRLAGRRARSSSFAEFVHEREVLEAAAVAPSGGPDWVARGLSFKGVLLEGMEVILIVTALASRPGGAPPALLGAGLAAVCVVGLGAVLHRPLRRLPETELKFVVGLVLTTFGTFFCAEGLDVHWPLGDGILPLLLAGWLGVSLSFTVRLARHHADGHRPLDVPRPVEEPSTRVEVAP